MTVSSSRCFICGVSPANIKGPVIHSVEQCCQNMQAQIASLKSINRILDKSLASARAECDETLDRVKREWGQKWQAALDSRDPLLEQIESLESELKKWSTALEGKVPR